MFDDDYEDENESVVLESVKVAENENKPIAEEVKTESEGIKLNKINKVEIHELEDQLETKIEMEPETETQPKPEKTEFEPEIEVKIAFFNLTQSNAFVTADCANTFFVKSKFW